MPRLRLTILFTVCVLAPSAHLSAAEDPRDFSGVWQAFATTPPLQANKLPDLTAEGQVLVADFSARYPNPVEPSAYCVPAGVPDMMTRTGGSMEIVQVFSRVTLLGTDGQVRRVFIDGRSFPEDGKATSAGYSIGHWERDTLVVETRALDESLVGRWPRTQDMVITERVTKLHRAQITVAADPAIASTADDQVLEIALTFTDHVLYREPQSLTVYYQRLGVDALPAQSCAAELWQQALDAANP
jgi:hypothetical protein